MGKREPLHLGVVLPFNPAADTITVAREAERLGFHSAWLGDHLTHNMFPESLEAWTLLGALARETKRIRLGVGVTDPHRRNPALLAQTAVTVDHLSDGRVDVGIGPGEAMNLDPYGIAWDHPVGKMEETIRLLRLLWTAQPVDFEGRHYRMRAATVAPPPVQRPGPPIWVGGNRPRTLRITGALADGWLPMMASPEDFRRDLEQVRRAAAAAGRDPNAILPGIWLTGAVGGDRDKALEQAARAARTFALHTPMRIRAGGVDVPEGFDLTEFVPTPESRDALRRAAANIPVEAVEGCLLYGGEDDCVETIEAYRRAGARLVVLSASAVGGSRLDGVRFIGERVLPHFAGD